MSANGLKPTHCIGFPPASLAEDSTLITHLTKLINSVYTVAEKGIFNENYTRTNAEEVRDLMRSGQLALASTSVSSPFTQPPNIIGCIRVLKLSPSIGDFGMLVTAPKARGSGVGRQLVEFAEAHSRSQGATTMQLELLVPTDFVSEIKAWVQVWYEKIGYRVVKLEDFGKSYPVIAQHVCTPTEYRIFQKAI